MEGRGELGGELAGVGREGWNDPEGGRAESVRVRKGCLARAFQTADCTASEQRDLTRVTVTSQGHHSPQ